MIKHHGVTCSSDWLMRPIKLLFFLCIYPRSNLRGLLVFFCISRHTPDSRLNGFSLVYCTIFTDVHLSLAAGALP